MIENNYGLILVLSTPCMVLVAVLLVRHARDGWRRYRWIPVPATMVEVGTTRDGLETIESMMRERGPWWVDYRYRTLGATRLGKARVWRGPRPKAGTAVTIYLKPKAWKKSALITTPRGLLRPALLVGGFLLLLTVFVAAIDAYLAYRTGSFGNG